jgi:type I restriction enzyme, S subunit
LRFLKIGCGVGWGRIINEFEIQTSSNFFQRELVKESDLISVNSIIFPKRGGAIATNKRRLVNKEPILVDSNTMAVIPDNEISIQYFYQWFITIDLSKLGNDGVIPQVNNKDLNPILFSLPPLSEQKRIVAEIERQLAKTKQLKEHIISNQQATEQLLKALLHQAFEVEETVTV